MSHVLGFIATRERGGCFLDSGNLTAPLSYLFDPGFIRMFSSADEMGRELTLY